MDTSISDQEVYFVPETSQSVFQIQSNSMIKSQWNIGNEIQYKNRYSHDE